MITMTAIDSTSV